MVFSDLIFLYLFLPITFLLYYPCPRKFKNLFIMIMGLIFYAWGEPLFIFIMLLSTMVDYTAGLLLHKFDHNNKLRVVFLLLSVIMNLTILGLFKYSGFIIENINHFFGTSITNPELPLPIGISFYTFQSMSYTIDLYKRNIKVQKNFITFMAFVTLFPQVVAGPIVRYEDIAEELEHRKHTIDMIYEGVVQFVLGLGKKVLIANNIGALWDTVLSLHQTGQVSVLTAWLGILGFTFQIYFDFSGYSDMALGLGKMLGFKFPINFDYPYMSKSISEFWRRWHITLGNWFKSYVYFPLGGSKKGKSRTVFNLAVVWLLTGIWHGASWNFILWGVLYGVVIILEKLFLGKILEKLPTFIRVIYTMFLVIMGWVLFQTPDLPTAVSYTGSMFNFTGVLVDNQALYLLSSYGILLILSIIGCTNVLRRGVNAVSKQIPWLVNYGSPVVVATVFLISTSYLVNAGYNPFLYFNF